MSTPVTDFNDTRTACAQTSQSIPNTVMLMERTSACAAEAMSSKADKSKLTFFITLLVLLLEQQITEIHGVAHMLFWEQCSDIAIDWHLRSEAHRVVLVDPEKRWSKEHLMCFALRNG